MKIFTYYHFARGQNVTIQEILKEEKSPEETYFVLTVKETEEKIRVWVENKNASLIVPNAILFDAKEECEAIGYTFWNNGTGPFGILLP